MIYIEPKHFSYLEIFQNYSVKLFDVFKQWILTRRKLFKMNKNALALWWKWILTKLIFSLKYTFETNHNTELKMLHVTIEINFKVWNFQSLKLSKFQSLKLSFRISLTFTDLYYLIQTYFSDKIQCWLLWFAKQKSVTFFPSSRANKTSLRISP